MKLEVITIPVLDVERTKRFYAGLGWRLDADIGAGRAFRLVQFTPPGSSCSVQFGQGLTPAGVGTLERIYLVVADLFAARAQVSAQGVEVSEVFHRGGSGEQESGADPARTSYASFASFKDPDGNGWLLQEVTTRLPGRVTAAETTFSDASELAGALRRAEAAHGRHEKQTGLRDENWADWYANYMVREQAGKQPPL
jgi:catechol 2,3-dioxygenase-like lactoylglutathione lyase family enzyme